MKKAAIIPVAIIVVIVLAYATTDAYRVPTVELRFTEAPPAVTATVEYEVSGLKCRGTSRLFAQQIQGVPGVVSLTTFARTHSAIVEYDPTLTDPEAIRLAFERTIERGGETYKVFEMVREVERR